MRQPIPDLSRQKISELKDDLQDRNRSSRHLYRPVATSHQSTTEPHLPIPTLTEGTARGNSHDEGRVQGVERKSGDDSNCGTCSSPPSTIIGEGDSLLGEIQKALYTPAAHRYPLSRNMGSERVLISSTPSFLSTSYASPLRDSLERSPCKPLGTGVYSEKVLAGDERHVSVALRAYAMSVAEDEKKAWHSPVNMKNYTYQSLSVEPSVLRPVRMFTEDEIVSKSQSLEGTWWERVGRAGKDEIRHISLHHIVACRSNLTPYRRFFNSHNHHLQFFCMTRYHIEVQELAD